MGQYHPDLSKQATLFSGHITTTSLKFLGRASPKRWDRVKKPSATAKLKALPSSTRIHPRQESISDKNPSPTSIHLRQVSISDKYPSPTSIHLRQVSISD
ncbi:hypothetical protein E4U46_000885, partial [Claviceps purpurea]